MASGSTGKLTLLEHLSGPIGYLAQKKLFGGYDVPLLGFFLTGVYLFQIGAILGRARRDRLEPLAAMLLAPDYQSQLGSVLKQMAEAQVAKYEGEPDTFLDFFLKTEVPSIDLSDLEALKQISKQKRRLGEVLPKAEEWVFKGIAFGVTFPDATERLWRKFGDQRDADSWAEMRRMGLDIPEQDTALSLEEMENTVLLEVAAYANEYFPDLVEPLGLRLS